jgi:hypothetical protein
MRRAALLLVVLSAVPAVMQAQLCTGQAPWSSGSIKAGGRVEFGDGFTDILGDLSFGKDHGLFLGVGAGISNGGGETAFLVEGGIGKELSKPVSGKLELCPVANVLIQFPKDDFSFQEFSGGVSGGYPVQMSSSSMALILTGAAQLAVDHESISGSVCSVDCSNTDILGIFDAGVGLVFNNRISLVPVLRIPTRGGISLRIGANVAVGKKK